MANAIMTESTFGSAGMNIIVTLIADQFISALRNRVRVLNYVRSVGDALANGGDTVRVPIAPTVASFLMTDGQSVVMDDTAGTTASVVLNRHRQVAFGETLMAMAKTANTPQMAVEMQSRLYGLFNDIESDVMSAAITGFVTNVFGTYNTPITEANFVAAIGSIMNNKAPQDKPIMAFVAPNANGWQALAQIADFSQASARGYQMMSPTLANGNPADYGVMVPWHGTYVSASNNVNVIGTSTNNVLLYPDALCVAFRAIPIPNNEAVEAANFVDSDSTIAFQIIKSWNKDRLANEIVIHALYGYAVGRDAWGCLLKS